MARAVATCKCEKCGEAFDVVAYKRNRQEADRFVEWAEANITECRACEIAEGHAQALAAFEGMPELTGSEKQVKWAIDIRARLTREAEGDHFSSKQLKLCWKSVVAAKTESRFWIDHRDDSAYAIVDALLRKEPEIFETAEDAAESVKSDAYAELDGIAEKAGKEGKMDVLAQVEEVRRCYEYNFASEEATPAAVLLFRLAGGFDARNDVRATLKAGRVWDSEQHTWVRPADAQIANDISKDVTLYDIADHIKGSNFAEMANEGVIIHAYCDKTGRLLQTDGCHADTEDMSEFIRFHDLGLPDDCTVEEVYAALCEHQSSYYRSALYHFAQRVNAQRSHYRNRKD